MSEISKDISSMSFEKALEALEKVVGDLERGEATLEESIRIYARGEALKSHCTNLLKGAEERIEKIKLAGDGTFSALEPLNEA